MSGILFVIGTPIGNLNDLSPRVCSCLANCDVIFAEDTRHTLKLMNHLGLKKPLVSYHDFNEKQRLKKFEHYAEQGLNIGLVSDAGMPLISDPGYYLIERAIQLGLTVTPISGPSAFLLALTASGLSCDRFSFEGFLPNNKAQRKLRLEKLSRLEQTVVFYIAPHDLGKLIPEISQAFGLRRACLAKEITKKHEQFIRADLDSLTDQLNKSATRGEFVLVVEGAKPEVVQHSQDKVIEQLRLLTAAGVRLSDAAAQVAKVSGWSRSKIYKLGMEALK